MNSNVTRDDVVRYFANELDRTRRREIEAACRSNEQVQRWFDELTPSEEYLVMQSPPETRMDFPALRALAATTYLSVEREEQVHPWSEWMRSLATNSAPVSVPHGEIVPGVLFHDRYGTLLYREQAPLTLVADPRTFSVPPPDVPCLYPNLGSGRLVIRQTLDRVPGGMVEVVVVRRRGENEVETFPPVRIQLEHTEPPEAPPYWYADVSLKSLIGEFKPGDDFIYGVAVAPGA